MLRTIFLVFSCVMLIDLADAFRVCYFTWCTDINISFKDISSKYKERESAPSILL
jgi:hypothetical protein